MLLVIHNLPSTTRYADVKSLLHEKCGLTDVIIDNLVNEGKNKRVTVGLASEDDGSFVVRKLNGLFINGDQLYIEDKRRTTADQPYWPGGFDANVMQGQGAMVPSTFASWNQTAPAVPYVALIDQTVQSTSSSDHSARIDGQTYLSKCIIESGSPTRVTIKTEPLEPTEGMYDNQNIKYNSYTKTDSSKNPVASQMETGGSTHLRIRTIEELNDNPEINVISSDNCRSMDTDSSIRNLMACKTEPGSVGVVRIKTEPLEPAERNNTNEDENVISSRRGSSVLNSVKCKMEPNSPKHVRVTKEALEPAEETITDEDVIFISSSIKKKSKKNPVKCKMEPNSSKQVRVKTEALEPAEETNTDEDVTFISSSTKKKSNQKKKNKDKQVYKIPDGQWLDFSMDFTDDIFGPKNPIIKPLPPLPSRESDSQARQITAADIARRIIQETANKIFIPPPDLEKLISRRIKPTLFERFSDIFGDKLFANTKTDRQYIYDQYVAKFSLHDPELYNPMYEQSVKVYSTKKPWRPPPLRPRVSHIPPLMPPDWQLQYQVAQIRAEMLTKNIHTK